MHFLCRIYIIETVYISLFLYCELRGVTGINIYFWQPPIVLMDLLILRHAKAGDRSEGKPDDARTLTKKGIRDIRRVSRWMIRSGSLPDVIVTSPLARAKETAEILARSISFDGDVALWEELRPEQPSSAVVDRLSELGEGSLPLLVGHEPQLSSLVASLIGAGSDARIRLEKGGIARIRNIPMHPGGTGELQWLLTPRLFRDIT
jgi:phosphohistidine phosphatase